MKNDIPVAQDDEVKLEIIGVGEKGDGIAKVKKYTVIVTNKDLQIGDKVHARITNVRPNYAFAEVIE